MGEDIPSKYKDKNVKIIEKSETVLVIERKIVKFGAPYPILGYYLPYAGGIDIITDFEGDRALGGKYFKKDCKIIRITIEVIGE